MTDTVIPFPAKRTLPTYRGRCDQCGVFRYFPEPSQPERWARSHANGYGHTVRLADGRIFQRSTLGMEIEYGSFD